MTIRDIWTPDANGIERIERENNYNAGHEHDRRTTISSHSSTWPPWKPTAWKPPARTKAALLFPIDHTHTSSEGAELNAQSVVIGLEEAHSPASRLSQGSTASALARALYSQRLISQDTRTRGCFSHFNQAQTSSRVTPPRTRFTQPAKPRPAPPVRDEHSPSPQSPSPVQRSPEPGEEVTQGHPIPWQGFSGGPPSLSPAPASQPASDRCPSSRLLPSGSTTLHPDAAPIQLQFLSIQPPRLYCLRFIRFLWHLRGTLSCFSFSAKWRNVWRRFCEGKNFVVPL